MIISSPFAVVFPGQGSQKNGMLQQLVEIYPAILNTFNEASETLGYDMWSLVQGDARLHETRYTQPAILTSSIAIWRLLTQYQNFKPSFLMGHSLGEYSALVAADVINFTDALKLVEFRGKVLQETAPSGNMVAVIGLNAEKVQELCIEASKISGTLIEPANFNAPEQIVVAGYSEATEALIPLVRQQGGKTLILPVSVLSHCQLMSPASAQLSPYLNKVTFHEAKIPVISNITASPSQNGKQLKQGLIDQLTLPVRWVESQQFLLDAGINQLIECGAGNVLTGLSRKMPPLTSLITGQPEYFIQVLDFLSSPTPLKSL